MLFRSKFEIRKDWERLKSEVSSHNAHNLSETMFTRLSANTSGSGKLIKYHPDAEKAKERSYSFKAGFMTSLWKERSNKYDLKIHFKDKVFESLIFQLIKENIQGRSLGELKKEHNISIPNSKSSVHSVIKRILNANPKKQIKEFDSEEIEIKTVPINPENLKPYESMSFPKMSLKDLIYEDWNGSNEESSLKIQIGRAHV